VKHLKILAFAAMACAALMAFASTALATTLDTTAGNIKTGTLIHAVAKEAVLEDTLGFIENTCESTTQGKTTNETGTTVTGTVESLTWSNCTFATSTIKGGKLHIKWTSGMNGTVTSSGAEVTTKIPGGVCIYGSGEGITLGTLDGVASTTEEAKLTVNTVVKLLKTESGSCLSSARWTATYVVDNPKGLTVKS
jgi:hypothetical protein